MSTEVTEVPQASCLCMGPGSIQAKLRPGIWIPGIRSLHLYEEVWKVSANPIVCAKDVLQAVTKLHARNLHGRYLTVTYVEENADKSRVEMMAFSRMRHTFVIQLTFANQENDGCTAKARAFSSGLFPSWFPLNFLWSCLLFFVPFYDSGRNKRWLNMLREQMTIPIEIVKQGRKC